QVAVARRGGGENLLVAAAEAELAERAHPRALVRGEHGLAHAERSDQPHLRKALQRRPPRVRGLARVGDRRDVSRRQARVVVRGSDDPVEVELGHGGCLDRAPWPALSATSLRSSDTPLPPRRRASTRPRPRWWP